MSTAPHSFMLPAYATAPYIPGAAGMNEPNYPHDGRNAILQPSLGDMRVICPAHKWGDLVCREHQSSVRALTSLTLSVSDLACPLVDDAHSLAMSMTTDSTDEATDFAMHLGPVLFTWTPGWPVHHLVCWPSAGLLVFAYCHGSHIEPLAPSSKHTYLPSHSSSYANPLMPSTKL